MTRYQNSSVSQQFSAEPLAPAPAPAPAPTPTPAPASPARDYNSLSKVSENGGEKIKHDNHEQDEDQETVRSVQDQEPPYYPDGGRQAYLSLLGCFLSLTATIGLTNANGTIENYVADKILYKLSASDISWIFSVFNLTSFGAIIFLGPLYVQIGVRAMFIISWVLFGVGLMCFSVSRELYQFILSYFVCGMGLSFSFTASINTVTQWFNKRRSTAVGVMYIGSGIGGIVIPIVLKALFAAVGFGWAIRILAFIALMIMAISVLLTTDRRKELGLDHSGNPIIGAIKGVDFSRVKEPLYLVYLVACIGNSGPFFLTLNYLVSYATANGWDEGLAYYLPVAYNAASILGRVIGGYLSDRYGRFNIFICANAIAAIAVFVCWIPPTIGHSKGGLFAFAVIGGFTSGSYFQSSPTCLAQISDPKRFSAQFGAFSCVIAIFNFAFLPIGGAIISAGGGGGPGYDKFVILVAVLQFLGLAFSIITRVMLEGFRLTAV